MLYLPFAFNVGVSKEYKASPQDKKGTEAPKST